MTDLHIPAAETDIDLSNPSFEQFESFEDGFETIERGMERILRYNGQTPDPVRLGSHVSYVADELEEEGEEPIVQFYGLNHDSGETILQDIPRPVRKQISGYDEMEDQLVDTMWDYFGVEDPSEDQWEKVMRADDKVLIWEIGDQWPDEEAGDIVAGGIYELHEDEWDYNSREELVEDLDSKYELSVSPEESVQMFQDRYQELQGKMDSQPRPDQDYWER